MIQNTSRQAYKELKNVNAKQATVFSAIERLGKVSNYDIAYELGWAINRVTPRVQELREMDLVEESHKDRHPITERTVIYWKVKHDPVIEPTHIPVKVDPTLYSPAAGYRLSRKDAKAKREAEQAQLFDEPIKRSFT